LAVYGHPRATGDIDLWIHSSQRNAERVLRALDAFGAPLFQIDREDLETPGTVFQIGISPRRIDLLTSIEGVSFERAWEDRIRVEIGSTSLFVLSRAHFIQNKRALGRPQDIADIERLTKDNDEKE
ncbi:MAG: hypothetical protein PPP56_06465, partial [Longimonas sp.]|uniref:hypothetical protein n=1 Tax=Longimonas sp. TaxID=2039626 RepID=UPI003358A562